MPTPKDGETEDEFVERCIPVVLEDGTAEDGTQAAAICHSMFGKKEVTRGLYLAEPHGQLTANGKKQAIAKADILPLEGKHILVSKDKAYGIIDLSTAQPVNVEEFDSRFEEHRVTTNERRKWWDGKDELYLYEIKEFDEFDPPRNVEIPDNVKFIIREVQFKDETDEEEEVKEMRSAEMLLDSIKRAFWSSDVVQNLEDLKSFTPWVAATYPDENYLITEWKDGWYRVGFEAIDDRYKFEPLDEWKSVEKKEEWGEKLKAIKEADEKAGRRIRGDKVDVLKKLHDKFNDVMDSIKDLIGFAEYDDMKPKEWFEKEEAGVKTLALKDGRTGLLTWTTNAFKDRENEIFTTKSIEDLIERYSEKEMKGEYKFWHIPGSKFGEILWQGLSGRFLVEVGVFDDTLVGEAFKAVFEEFPDGHPEVAPEGWGTSHGFLYKSEDRDDGVYEWFDKEETSVLPASAAANPYNPKMEVLSMDEKQKDALSKLVKPEVIEAIELTGETETKRLEETIEFKSNDSDVKEEVKEEVEPAVEEVAEIPKSEEVDEGAKDYLTQDDVEPAFSALAESIVSIKNEIFERMDSIDTSLKALTETDDEKFKKQIELTPKESLKATVESVIGRKETQVDGRTALGKDGPEEAAPITESLTGISLIDGIKARNAEKIHGTSFLKPTN